MIEKQHPTVSIVQQCTLLELNRSGVYYTPSPESDENLQLLRVIDEQHLQCPFYGSRQMRDHLIRLGFQVNRKRVQRLMKLMGLYAIYPKPRTSDPHPGHKIYPYLLRDVAVSRPNQVWCRCVSKVAYTFCLSGEERGEGSQVEGNHPFCTRILRGRMGIPLYLLGGSGT